MRKQADRQRIGRFLSELGRGAANPATLYLSGGATAVLHLYRFPAINPSSFRAQLEQFLG